MAYTVKAVADIAGISVRTLHHYDAIGLLKPAQKSAAGYRLYTEGASRTVDPLGRPDALCHGKGNGNGRKGHVRRLRSDPVRGGSAAALGAHGCLPGVGAADPKVHEGRLGRHPGRKPGDRAGGRGPDGSQSR
ncbi:MAG: MerR family transcriptional regulator [Symbiobacteriia bacterium]